MKKYKLWELSTKKKIKIVLNSLQSPKLDYKGRLLVHFALNMLKKCRMANRIKLKIIQEI